MRSNLALALTLTGLTLPLALAACNDGGRGKQFFGPGSTGATNSSGTTPTSLGSFAGTGAMTEPRFRHTATVLRDNRVLVVGGAAGPPNFTPSNTAEVWEPTAGVWQRTDAIAVPGSGTSGFLIVGGVPAQQTRRVDHAAVLLPNPGNPSNAPVLIMGGFGVERFGGGVPAGEALQTVFTFDPATNSFTQKTSMTTGRRNPLAVVLSNGTVLVTNGQDNTPGQGTIGNTIQTSEVYDIANDTWTALANGNTAGQHGYGQIFAAGNQVVVVDGASVSITGNVGFAVGSGASPRGEIFNVQAGSFSAGQPLASGRAFFGGDVDTSGSNRVFIAGGVDPDSNGLPLLGTTEIFTASTGAWAPGPVLTTPRGLNTVSEIGGNAAAGTGDMLIIGGRSSPIGQPAVQTAQCEVYGVVTNSILGTVNMAGAREDHRSVRLNDGRILVVGGFLGGNTGNALASCEVYTR